MKSRKKTKKQEVTKRAKRYELTEIVKEAMCQGIIMEQMYGAEKDTMMMIEEDDPIKLTDFILQNIDDMRYNMETFRKKSLH